MSTGDDNERIGAGGILAAGVLSLGLLLYLGHAIVETSRWARDALLRFIDLLGLTELAAFTLSVGDIIYGVFAALMTWALWHLYGHHFVEATRPAAFAILEAVHRHRRVYATLASWLLIVATPLGIGLSFYDSARSIDDASRLSPSPAPIASGGNAPVSGVPFDARWVVAGRSLDVGPTDFVEIKKVASPFAAEQVAENACAMDEEFTSEQLAACVEDLKKHPPRTGWGGPRRWFVHRVNGRLLFDPVAGSPPLPRARPQLPLELSPTAK